MLSHVVIFSILSSKSPIDFHDKTLNVLVTSLKYFSYEKYVKWLCNVPKEKYLAPLRILYPFIKSFVNLFVDITSTFFDSSFNSYSTSVCFVLFELILLLKLNSVLSKSVLFAKLAIPFLLAKFAYSSLAVNFSDYSLLNSGVVIYLSGSWLVFFFYFH